MKGFHDWLRPSPHRSKAPTYGSLFRPDILLMSAYYEQFHKLGWFQICLGQISLKWSQAVTSYQIPICPHFNGNRWAVAFITLMWKFTHQLWHHRNQLVHGETVDEAVSTQLSILHNKVTYQYQQYQNVSSYVLPRHEYLFTQHSLDY
jgi:hypothetical protein